MVAEKPIPPTVAPERGAPVPALVTVPVVVPKVESGVKAIVPAERVFPGSTVTSVVAGLNPDRLIVRVCGPGGTPASVKFPLLSVVVEKSVPPTVAPARGATVPALVTVPISVLVLGSGVRGIVPTETDVPATTVTVFVAGSNPGALTDRRSPGPEGMPASVKFPLLSVVVVMNELPTPTVAPARGAASVPAMVTVPVIVPKEGSGVRAIAPAETDVPATTVTAFVAGVNPDRLTARVCGPEGTPVSVKFPLLSVVVVMDALSVPTVALARGAPLSALVTVPVTVPVVTLLPLVCATSDCPDPQPDRALRSASRTTAKRMPWL